MDWAIILNYHVCEMDPQMYHHDWYSKDAVIHDKYDILTDYYMHDENIITWNIQHWIILGLYLRTHISVLFNYYL